MVFRVNSSNTMRPRKLNAAFVTTNTEGEREGRCGKREGGMCIEGILVGGCGWGDIGRGMWMGGCGLGDVGEKNVG